MNFNDIDVDNQYVGKEENLKVKPNKEHRKSLGIETRVVQPKNKKPWQKGGIRTAYRETQAGEMEPEA